jgi:hypothetical protein
MWCMHFMTTCIALHVVMMVMVAASLCKGRVPPAQLEPPEAISLPVMQLHTVHTVNDHMFTLPALSGWQHRPTLPAPGP